MKKLLIIMMACYGLSARAQVDESKDFLYFYSDSLVNAKRVTLRPGLSGYWQLRADHRAVPEQNVKFFNNRDGFFANTRKLNLTGSTAFSERVLQGKINIYQVIDYDSSFYQSGYQFRDRKRTAVNASLFYNTGFEDLKRVNYRNLREEMADNTASLDLLEAYRKNMNTTKTLYVAAGASAIAGMVSFLVRGSAADLHSNPNLTSSFLLMGLGAGFAIGGITIRLSASRNLESAIDVYNR